MQSNLVSYADACEAMRKGKRVAHYSWTNGQFLFERPQDVLSQAVIQKAISIPATVKAALLDKGDILVTSYNCFWDGLVLNNSWKPSYNLAQEIQTSAKMWLILD